MVQAVVASASPGFDPADRMPDASPGAVRDLGTDHPIEVVRTAGLTGLVGRASDRIVHTGADQVLPVLPELSPLLPWPGLRKGATVAVSGATSLLVTLLAGPSRAGSWCAVVGLPAISPAAAAQSGVELGRLALVPYPGAEWPAVTAALLDGFDVVVVRPGGVILPAQARRLAARARQRGAVLVGCGGWPGADVMLDATRIGWHGLGSGRGRLRHSELEIVARGRGAAARPRRVSVRLPAGPEHATVADWPPAARTEPAWSRSRSRPGELPTPPDQGTLVEAAG